MRHAVRGVLVTLCGLTALQMGGCGITPQQFIAGSTGATAILKDHPSVNVITPANDLAVTGGTQVDVNWTAFASTPTSTLSVILDPDQDPNNANEIVSASALPLTQTSSLVDTTQLAHGSYSVGVLVVDVGDVKAYGYANGQVVVAQRPQVFFTGAAGDNGSPLHSARQNLKFDRTERVNPTFQVGWTVTSPDASVTVDLFLDPDQNPNGNEIKLYHSTNQTADSFTFDMPTASFLPGTYRFLALVSDGKNSYPYYAPGSIRVNGRLAGYVDLRPIGDGQNATAGCIFEGFNPRDNAGSFMLGIGDYDNDGFDDLMLMSQFAKPHFSVNLQRTGEGEAYMIYGRADRFRGVVNLNSIITLFRGEFFEGVPELADPIRPSRGIASFCILGDWDNDGVREMAFGLPFTDSTAGPRTASDNTGAFRTGGVVIAAGSAFQIAGAFPGGHVYNLADFGQVPYLPFSEAVCFEGWTTPNTPPGAFYKHSIDAGVPPNQAQLGARIHTLSVGDQLGESLDAYTPTSILISAPNRDPIVNTRVNGSIPGAGVVSLYFGGNIWDGANLGLPHQGPYRYILDEAGSPGFFCTVDAEPCIAVPFAQAIVPWSRQTWRIYGGFPGAALSGARNVGDFSDDGVPDISIGSPLSDETGGAAFIIFGRLPPLMLARDLAIEELGLPMQGPDPLGERVFEGVRVVGRRGERVGTEQGPAGDFNHDGVADVVIGSPFINNRRGGAAIFFGSRTVGNLTQQEIPFSELPSRGLGLIFEGETDGDLAGARVSGAGDVDGDGNDDILIAAPNRSVKLDVNQDGTIEIDRQNCGVVYLVYGSPDLKDRRSVREDGTLTEPGRLLLRDVGTATLPGAVFIGRNSGDHLGAGLGEMGDRAHGVARGGDVDGDGRADILMSSVSASPRNRVHAGEAYLIYGVGD